MSPEGKKGEKMDHGNDTEDFQESRHFEAHGELRMFAEGAVFVGARVVCAGGVTVRVEWKSAFYPGPRYRRSEEGMQDGVQMLPLGFHEAFDLYLRRLRDAQADTIVARSAAGDASSLDPRNPMKPDVAHALREGMRRAGLLAAGPSL
jgi:hypothetical protein